MAFIIKVKDLKKRLYLRSFKIFLEVENVQLESSFVVLYVVNVLPQGHDVVTTRRKLRTQIWDLQLALVQRSLHCRKRRVRKRWRPWPPSRWRRSVGWALAKGWWPWPRRCWPCPHGWPRPWPRFHGLCLLEVVVYAAVCVVDDGLCDVPQCQVQSFGLFPDLTRRVGFRRVVADLGNLALQRGNGAGQVCDDLLLFFHLDFQSFVPHGQIVCPGKIQITKYESWNCYRFEEGQECTESKFLKHMTELTVETFWLNAD